MYRFTKDDNREAQRFFIRAISLDPTFSRSYAGLSFTHFQNAFLLQAREREREIALAFETAGQGLEADPDDPAAHSAMGRALWLRRDDDSAIGELDQSVHLSPSYALAHYALSFVHSRPEILRARSTQRTPQIALARSIQRCLACTGREPSPCCGWARSRRLRICYSRGTAA
jgi:tetratricopeptide (TPR) repeat protein